MGLAKSTVKTMLEANKAITYVDDMLGGALGGIRGTVQNLRGGNMKVASKLTYGPGGGGIYKKQSMGIVDALKEGHKAVGNELSIGGYSAKKMAGSYIGASAVARVASGGGLYKDNSGNTDIMGIPLI